MAVQIDLLRFRNERLEEAFQYERRRRRRGKALKLPNPEEYNGGAVFWSPKKIQQAIDAQAQKEADEEALQLQKDEESRLRAEAKRLKAELLEQRKATRVAAAEQRRKDKLIKDAQREEDKHARQLAKQLKEDIKLARRINLKTLKKVLKPQRTVVDKLPTVDNKVAAPAQSRRGRQINLPTRFLQ